MLAASVLTGYHSASDRQPTASLQPLARYFESLLRKAVQDRRAGRDSAYLEGALVAEQLLPRQQDIKPLHVDLRPVKILRRDPVGSYIVLTGFFAITAR